MRTLCILVVVACFSLACGCDSQPAMSDSGVSKASVKVKTDAEGYTIEQRNIMARLANDNTPGAVKHLYVISGVSGQVLIYSTVKGKVTSSGKRLTPLTVAASTTWGMSVAINGTRHYTAEVLQDDGTYGSSDPYIYWWDVRGVYHQHYIIGDQIIHVTDQPLAVRTIVINLETVAAKEE